MFSVITTPWKADIWVHLSEESGFPSGSLSQEDSLEKEMATHSHPKAGYSPRGRKGVGHILVTE